MGQNSTTYTINFKAQYDSLSKLEQELAKIQKASGSFNLTEKEQERVQELIYKIQNLRKLINTKTDADGLLNVSDFKEIDKIFSKLLTQANSLSSALIKMLPVDLQSKINDLKIQIDELNKANQALGSQKGFSTKAFKQQANAIAFKHIQQAGPSANIADDQGNLIVSYTELKQKAEDLAEATRELTADEQQILQIWQEVEAEVQPIMEAWKTSWDELTAKIQANRASVSELLELMRSLQGQNNSSDSGASSPLAIDPKSAETYQQYTDIINNATSAIEQSRTQVQDHNREVAQGTKTQGAHQKQTDKTTKSYDKNKTALGKAVHNVISYGSALTLVRTIYNKLLATIKDMDKALTDMTVVTQLSRQQSWELVGTLQSLAKQTGTTTTEIANMTTKYLQQGQTLDDSLKLTEAAAKAARIAGISGSESINLLTNAMNGFQIEASQAMAVSDKFAALAASAATDYEELATALSKVAAQANLAGMSMDFTLGLLTKGIEVTREAPETIGTALKTVISRMRELTDYGETLEDNVDVNRVDKALKNIGVDLLDSNREFRNLEDVLTEIGEKWDTLNTNQQANVAVALAGTRQQSRLIAMMQDFDRTQQLVNISMNSAGATAAQHRKYMQGLEAAIAGLTTSYQSLITSFTNSDIAISVINTLASGLDRLCDSVGAAHGLLVALIPVLAMAAINSWNMAVSTAATTFKIDKQTASLKKNILAQAALIASQKLATVVGTENALVTFLNTAATQGLNAAIKANPFVAIISLVVALVSAWWALNRETDSGIRIQNVLKTLLESVKTLLNELFDAIGPILDLVMGVITVIINALVPILEVVINLASMIINTVSSLLSIVGGLFSLIQEAASKLKDNPFFQWLLGLAPLTYMHEFTAWVEKWTADIATWFETAEQKSARIAQNIAANQDKIYDLQQKKGTLDPLLEEYEQLSNKANKTAEDLERIAEIESEIGNLDESYKAAGGGINWSKVKEEAANAGVEAGQLLQENFNMALEGLATGVMQDEFRSGISDYYGELAKQQAEIGNISTTTAAAIAQSYKNALNALSDKEMQSLGEHGFEQLYKNISDFEQKLASDSTLSERLAAYEDAINNLPDEAKQSFKALYSIYAEYSDMLQGLSGEAKRGILEVIALTGMTENDYGALRNSFQRKEGESEEEFQKRFQEHLRTSFQAGSNLTQREGESDIDFQTRVRQKVIFELTQGQSQDFKNAVMKSFTESNQAILEQYAKSSSSLDNLKEASIKAAQGALSLDEMRELQAEYPDLFADKEWVAKFKAGEVDIAELKKKSTDEIRTQLELSKNIATEELNRLKTELRIKGVTEDLLKLSKQEAINKLMAAGYSAEEAEAKYSAWLDYASTINRDDMQLENLKYADLYATELWKRLADITAEEVKHKRLQGDLNKLAKEYESITNPEARLENLKKQAQVYLDMAKNASKLFNAEEKSLYGKAVESGYVVDGEVVVTTEELISLGADSSMVSFLTNSEKTIELFYDYSNAYLDGYRSVIKEYYNSQKDILEKQKEQYEEYWDKLDAYEDAQERAQSRDSIIAQLSSIAGGSDAASNSLRKDLLGQLADLNKEEAEERKQAARDAITKNIDDHVKSIDEKIAELNSMSEAKLTGIMEALGITPKFASGGLVDFTGPAWVDGTKTNPEAFLDATDTRLISQLVKSLDYGSLRDPLSTEFYDLTQIVVENINITTNELNDEQDFRASGNAFAEEFAKAIRQRGININVKR